MKAYVNPTDQYILPFESADHLTKAPEKHGVSKGLCQVSRNTLYGGDLFETTNTESATECCDACNNRGGKPKC